GETPVDLAGLMVDEVRLIGSRCGPFAPALRLLAGGGVTVQPLIGRVFSLEEGSQALRERGGMKNLLSAARE
ncbi:MAG: alcohol dehydrogenase, partial [Magnetococcales bacterium]|nr:alcohol dehydrogenase [Magnetococcales bacterium]